MSHTQKNKDNVAYGQLLRIIESISHTKLDMKYITQGVMAVDATNGLIIITVAIIKPDVLAH